MPQQAFVHPSFSGATHSRGWLVAGLEGPATDVVAAIMAPLFDTCNALVVEFARYFGMNPRPLVTETHRSRPAFILRVQPWRPCIRGVEDYRTAMCAWPLPARGSAQP